MPPAHTRDGRAHMKAHAPAAQGIAERVRGESLRTLTSSCSKGLLSGCVTCPQVDPWLSPQRPQQHSTSEQQWYRSSETDERE